MPIATALPYLGGFNLSLTLSGAGAITGLIPPYPGPAGGPPFQYNALSPFVPLNAAPSATKANWLAAPNFGITKVTSLLISAGSTAHTIFVYRPLNWTYFPNGLAKNTTVFSASTDTSKSSGNVGIYDDPGVYSTNYRYPTLGGLFPGQVADTAISSTVQMCCYQLADGSWQYDTVASGTFGGTLTMTTGTPNRAGGAILAGAPLFLFGPLTGAKLDPANGLSNAWQFETIVSVQNLLTDSSGELNALHQGDPLLVYSANATATDFINTAGMYMGY